MFTTDYHVISSDEEAAQMPRCFSLLYYLSSGIRGVSFFLPPASVSVGFVSGHFGGTSDNPCLREQPAAQMASGSHKREFVTLGTKLAERTK